MQTELESLAGRHEVAAALITFTDPVNLTEHQQRLDLDFPVLSDPTRTAYEQYGFGRGSVRRVWGLRSARMYLSLGRGGIRGLRVPTEDTLQLGGDVVIGPDGTIRYLYRSAGPDDRPPVADLIAAAVRT